ncbi:proline-specific peptidase [Nemania abortiva]|nr:proline-specific peptidase [Nemania abortiva]
MRLVYEGKVEWEARAGTKCRACLDHLGLYGGPGAGHEYLSPLYDLHDEGGILIVLYDQVGCGRSTHSRDKLGDESFWTFDLFIGELDNLIDHLKLRRTGFSLFGRSWGGMLARVSAARRSRGLKKLILASAPASFPLYSEGCRNLLVKLPENVRKTIEECERPGGFESSEFQQALAVDIQAGFAHPTEDPTSYLTMYSGPLEFTITEFLKGRSIGDDAREIEIDTLLLNSVLDEAQDLCIGKWFTGIPRVKWKRGKAISLCRHFLVNC